MSPGESYIWNCQSSEWTLHFSMQSMRAHLKQSTNRKIKEMSPGEFYDIPPIWNWQSSGESYGQLDLI